MNKPTDAPNKADWAIFDIPKDPALLVAVGEVTLRHSQLDHQLRLMIKTVAAITIPEAEAATAFDGSAKLRGQVDKIAKKRLGVSPEYLRLRALLERCRRATEKRNELVHEVWYRELESDVYKRRSKSAAKAVPTVGELQSLAREIGGLAKEMNDARLKGFLAEALAKKK